MKLVLLLPALVMISGCVSDNTALINSQGQLYRCANSGWGWLGAPVAAVQQHDCVKKAEAAGYHEIGEPAPAPKKTTDTTSAGSSGK